MNTSLTINSTSISTEDETAYPFTAEQNYATITTNNGSNGQANTLMAKASLYGIDTSNYVTYDPETGKTTIDVNGLQVAIETSQKINLSQAPEEDSFVSTTSEEDPLIEASSNKQEINSYIASTADYYQSLLEPDVYPTEEAKNLLKEWQEIIDSGNDLTSVTTSNTTIINGCQEFIDSYKKLEEKTNNFIPSQTTDEQDPVSDTTYSNIFIYPEADAEEDLLDNNPFFNSAFETSEYDEDEVTA